MKQKWTLGPVMVGKVEKSERVEKGWDYKSINLLDENGLVFAEVKGYSTDLFAHPDTVDKNSALIVKAPEMLSALNNIIEAYHRGQVTYRDIEICENIINNL